MVPVSSTDTSVRFLFLMNCSDMIKCFDSLWFYSNVVSSSRIEQSADAFNEDEVREEAPKPRSQIEEEKQHESTSAENFVTKCPICGEFNKEEVKEFAAKPEEEKRKSSSNSNRRRRRRRRSKRSLRKILGELDRLHLGFDYGNYMEFGLFDYEEIVTSGPHDQVLGSGIEYDHRHHPMNMKMPPLDDNVAMKEHLKSWAYAVACTVK